MSSSHSGTFTGSRIQRKEDPQILTGRARFVDDVQATGLLHACFVRSPVARARLVRVDTDDAKLQDGVIAVLTAADLSSRVALLDFSIPMEGLVTPTYPALSSESVRYVGEPVAIVVARSRALAEDAAALVDMEFETLPPVMTTAAAMLEDAPRLHDAVVGNLVYTYDVPSAEADAAFSTAEHVIDFSFDLHRWAAVPMETRGGIATYDPSTRELAYHVSTQSPYLMRAVLANALRHPQQLIHVTVPRMGGSFGLKWSPVREDVVVCAAARLLGVGVKWIEDRNENLVASGHAREDKVSIKIAADPEGKILAMKGDITVDLGAYPTTPSAALTARIMRCMLPGPYRVPLYSSSERVVCTNKAPRVPLRGPWAAETLVRERALDHLARVVGLTPVEIRLRNLLPLDEQPFESRGNFPLDGITAEITFRRALDVIGYEKTLAEIEQARAAGRVVGFGIATFMEPAPGTPELWKRIGNPLRGEQMRAKVEIDGRLTLYTQQTPHGQSHETTFAQIAADEFGVDFVDVRLIYGDTHVTPYGPLGTAGSRAATMATGAAILASRAVKEKVLDIASALLEADVRDLRIEDGMIRVQGVPAAANVSVADIAQGCYLTPHLMPPGKDLDLQATADYDGEGGGYAQATHCCWVEIDPDTGAVDVTRYLAVDDCGKLINPSVVEGQIRGAITMGIGGMLLEQIDYDDDGNCRTGTFMDYLLPTSTDVPDFELHHLEFETEKLVGSRGVGEGGTILAPAALTNAIEDAVVAAGGSSVTSSPLTPSRILELLGVIPSPSPKE